MAIYLNVPVNDAYILLSTGAVILVSTSDEHGNLNIAPITWHCPVDNDPVTKILFVTDIGHKTYSNIMATGRFVICLPHASQVSLVRELGSCSGSVENKLQKFNVEYTLSEKMQLAVPNGSIAYIECVKVRETIEKAVAIMIGEVIIAKVIKGCYRDRLISEKEMAKTIHQLGKDRFIQPGELID